MSILWDRCLSLTFPALMSAMELLFSRRALAKMAEMACWRIAKPMRMPCLRVNAPKAEMEAQRSRVRGKKISAL